MYLLDTSAFCKRFSSLFHTLKRIAKIHRVIVSPSRGGHYFPSTPVLRMHLRMLEAHGGPVMAQHDIAIVVKMISYSITFFFINFIEFYKVKCTEYMQESSYDTEFQVI